MCTSLVGASLENYDKMPELQQSTFQKRNVAYKARISDILNGSFIKDDVSAGYVRLGNLNVFRVNLIANFVYKSEQPNSANALIDDGTGRISLRAFENKNIFSKAEIGDFVMVIGRVREFGSERYIIPEIVKRLDDAAWANVRNSELKNIKFEEARPAIQVPAGEALNDMNEDVYSLIKSLDNGDGADFDAVVKNSKKENAEQAINKLLENGDIFEVKPGRLKVLE